MKLTITIIQVFISISLIALILIQSRGTGLGDIFGGGGESYHTKRGAEKLLFSLTIGLAILFMLISIISSFFI
ncbi:MAG: preprotein translocase subunit SecG [Patescibacteria group bacterium]|nr:preprotein translocase subunit SecG [Patescibacteria group bacterium]